MWTRGAGKSKNLVGTGNPKCQMKSEKIDPPNLLKTVAFIVGKKIQQSIFFFRFPLKI